jgi:hypothetical protein
LTHSSRGLLSPIGLPRTLEIVVLPTGPCSDRRSCSFNVAALALLYSPAVNVDILTGSLFAWSHADRSIDYHGLLIQSSAAIVRSADTSCSCSSTIYSGSRCITPASSIAWTERSFQSTLGSSSCSFRYATLQAHCLPLAFILRSTTDWPFAHGPIAGPCL